jgi:hypothetical protein
MAPAREIASAIEPVVDGIWHWHATPDGGGRIDSGHAVRVELDDGRIGCVLVDPVRLDGHAMQQLPHLVVAVVLTSSAHQRDAWRLRELHGAEVWAPADATGLAEEPDAGYRAGDMLPGGLVALAAFGVSDDSRFVLHLPDHEALFVDEDDVSLEEHDDVRPRVLLHDHDLPVVIGD